MGNTYNPLRQIQVKEALRKGKSARQALKDAGYSEGHIRRSTANSIVRDSMNELLTEADKRGIIDKAWKRVHFVLDSQGKQGDVIAANLALKDMTSKAELTNREDIKSRLSKTDLEEALKKELMLISKQKVDNRDNIQVIDSKKVIDKT